MTADDESVDKPHGVVEPVVHPPVVFLAAVVGAFFIDLLRPSRLPVPFADYIGGFLCLIGLFIALWAFVTMKGFGESPRFGKETGRLVVKGPFRFSRNPIYVVMGFVGAGIAFATTNLWMLLAVALALFVIRIDVIAKEEKFLSKVFGEEYEDYKRRVRRWL